MTPQHPTVSSRIRARRRAGLRRARLAVIRAQRRSPRQVAATVAAALILTALLLYGGGAAAMALLDTALGVLPQPHALPADSLVYDRGGALIADMHPPGETRRPVPLAQVSPTLVLATTAIEDRAFWHEGAIDAGRVLAAAWQDVTRGEASQGASTISMQLAKVRYLSSSHSLSLKLRQVFIARRLEATLTKAQIMEEYLNDIFYGHGATGIEAAAHVYFGTDAAHLDLAHAALLAGLPNQPTDLDPFRDLAAARARQRVVLDAMMSAGDITMAQAQAAAAQPLSLADGHADDVDRYPAFSDRVAAEVQSELHLDAYRDGLRITTTLDSHLQDVAQQLVTTGVDAIASLGVSDGALVSVDPATGEVLAYVGSAGAGHPGSQIDMASHPRSPGSAFKLFTYSAALSDRRVTMLTPIADVPYSLPTGGGFNGMARYTVHNYDMQYHGVLPLEEAFANSLNIPAVKVEMLEGVPGVLRTARQMGVTTLPAPDSGYGPSLTLGAYPMPLAQLAQAGAILAAGGTLHPQHVLLSVRDAGGAERHHSRRAGQVLDSGVAYIVDSILTDDRNRQMEFGANSDLTLPDHTVAAKTGTASDFRDNLTVGWTPHLATATWVGNADDSPMHGTTGITGAAPIWHAFMEQALQGRTDDWPAPPSDVVPGSLGGRSGWFLQGTVPGLDPFGFAGVEGCRFWDFDNGHYWYCGSGDSGLPGDPGGGGDGAPPPPAPPPGKHDHGHGGGGGG